MKIKHGMVLGAVLGLAVTQIAMADPTALELVKSGDSYVGVQSRNKILEVYSEKSAPHLEPNIWHIVYYDPSVMSKSVDVKFGAGQEMDVSHPMRPFMWPAKARDILDLSKIKVDSDQALRKAASQPLVSGIVLRSSRMTLENTDDGVVWKVEFWAAKTADPTTEVGIGYVCISAYNGTVVKTDLHPGRVS